MGARGPAAKPTILKILQGNPGDHPLNLREPAPLPCPEQCPDPPSRFSAEAKEEWRRAWPQLKACGLLTTADLKLFEIYCEEWAQYVKLSEKTKRLGTEVVYPGDKTSKGKPRVKSVGRAPWLMSKDRTIHNLLQLAAEFGMSPAARTRIQMFEDNQQRDDLRKRLLGA